MRDVPTTSVSFEVPKSLRPAKSKGVFPTALDTEGLFPAGRFMLRLGCGSAKHCNIILVPLFHCSRAPQIMSFRFDSRLRVGVTIAKAKDLSDSDKSR